MMNQMPSIGTLVRNSLLTIFCLLLLTACLGKSTEGEDEDAVTLQSITVLPAMIASDTRADLTAEEALELSKGAQLLDTLIAEYFAENSSVKILSQEQVDSFEVDYKQNSTGQILEIGRQLHSDGILYFTVHRYKEREGTQYAVVSPASAAFEYRLLASSDGQSLCYGEFDEEQKPVTENILNIREAMKRGMKWITVRELSKEGFQEIIQTCRHLK